MFNNVSCKEGFGTAFMKSKPIIKSYKTNLQNSLQSISNCYYKSSRPISDERLYQLLCCDVLISTNERFVKTFRTIGEGIPTPENCGMRQ